MKSKREKFEEILQSDEFGLLSKPQKKAEIGRAHV